MNTKSIIVWISLLLISTGLTVLCAYCFPPKNSWFGIGYIPACFAVVCILKIMKISDDYEN